jgi:hypothetical protein
VVRVSAGWRKRKEQRRKKDEKGEKCLRGKNKEGRKRKKDEKYLRWEKMTTSNGIDYFLYFKNSISPLHVGHNIKHVIPRV